MNFHRPGGQNDKKCSALFLSQNVEKGEKREQLCGSNRNIGNDFELFCMVEFSLALPPASTVKKAVDTESSGSPNGLYMLV